MPLKLDQTHTAEEKSEGNFGFYFLSLANALCGQNLHIPPKKLKVGIFWTAILAVHSAIIALVVIFYAISTIATFAKHRDDFGQALFTAAGFLGMLECLIRIVYTTVRKKKMESIAKRVYAALNHPGFQAGARKFSTNLSRGITILITILFTSFIISIGANYLSTFGQLDNYLEKSAVNSSKEVVDKLLTSGQVPLEVIESWSYICAFFQFWPPIRVLKLYAGFLHVINFLAIGRIIVSDTLFYAWYIIIINRYHTLAKSLSKALDRDGGEEQLTEWLNFHQNINDLLKEINALAAPGIVAAVICTGLQLCIISFVIVKLQHGTTICSFLMFGIGSVYQVYVYSLLGQKIKDKVTKVHSEVYKGPWIENDSMKQHAALIICTASSDRVGHCLPGAPFFSMSLEFFASMVSVVFTYFMVLIQLNKN
ncbi:uncharacterized protein LOC132204781 [Neocloeon triangulifer]|uniref:uncharacterized protein LOC132204781 n=1 Tax=Neocloeon triangulifer TaxID=2078957 RepID=UPI00286F646A|nr:uncharacterized protein LOC132204781 [Neocloeon triangulifer]